MDESKELIATIQSEDVVKWYGEIKRNVYLSDERIHHIFEHHPDDYGKYKDFIAEAIQQPDIILNESKHPMTAMFVKRIESSGMNVIVKLALATDDGDRSFVVTMHAIGEKRLKRLKKAHKVIYNSGEWC